MIANNESLEAQAVLIFGATGLIGSHITRSIIGSKDAFQRVAIFTSPDTVNRKAEVLKPLVQDGIEIILGDIEKEEDVRKAYIGIDTVISCLGRNMIAHQTTLIRLAAETTSLKWFFPSEYGTDVEYGPASAQEIPHQKKLKVRAELAKVERSLSHTYVVTGPYGDGDPGLYLSSNLGAEQTGSFDVRNKTAVLIGDGHLKIGLTMMREYGEPLRNVTG